MGWGRDEGGYTGIHTHWYVSGRGMYIYGVVCIQTGGSGKRKVSTRTHPRARGVDEDASSARAVSAMVSFAWSSGWDGSAQLADCCINGEERRWWRTCERFGYRMESYCSQDSYALSMPLSIL